MKNDDPQFSLGTLRSTPIFHFAFCTLHFSFCILQSVLAARCLLPTAHRPLIFPHPTDLVSGLT
jgi:hypothetical protein